MNMITVSNKFINIDEHNYIDDWKQEKAGFFISKPLFFLRRNPTKSPRLITVMGGPSFQTTEVNEDQMPQI